MTVKVNVCVCVMFDSIVDVCNKIYCSVPKICKYLSPNLYL